MMAEKVLSRSVRLMFAGGLALGATAAFAQDSTTAAPDAPVSMQRVEVTGSRIPMAAVEGTSPVTVLGAKDIKTDGVRNVESLLNNLPQVFAAQTGSVVNGASGTATVDLRGLGSNRTLVLVNGHRLPQGSPNSTAADLNQIPTALIKRVEVLTGGAGAVYGADAVAGVVNFIMNDNFQGVQIDANYSGFNHRQQGTGGVADLVSARSKVNANEFKLPGNAGFDGRSKDASLLMGGNFEGNKGNATLFLSYKQQDALLQGQRDYSSCSLSSSKTGYSCGGSSTNATGRITNTTDGKVWTVTDAAGTPRAYNGATDVYNFGPINHYIRPDERYGAAASVHYDVTEQARLYADFAVHDDRTEAQIAPGGLFGDLYTVRGDNPLLSPAWKTALGLVNPTDSTDVVVQRRNVEGGGRVSMYQNTSFRSIIGVKGEVGNWRYDVFAQTAKVRGSSSANNYFSTERAKRAMDVVNQNGKAVCASAVNGSDANCVPYNPWKAGGVTPEQLAYLQIPGTTSGFTSQQIQGATIATDLGDYGIKLPTAKTGVGLSFGLERRVETLQLDPDAPSAAGDLSGSGGPTTAVKGSYTVKDVFGEVRVPILEDAPMAKLLSVNSTFRHSDINTGIKANTYGVGIEWAPVSMARLRGSYQKAVRAPNVVELFSPAGLNLYDNDADPCAGSAADIEARVVGGQHLTQALCARTGVKANQYGNIQDSPAGQYNYLQGGNAKLKPEQAKSTTFGLVLTPMNNLSVTVDYFNIKVEDTISAVSPTTTLEKCLATGDARFCSQISRDSLGTLWLLPEARIVATSTNIGSVKTSGIDLGANYFYRLGAMGSLAVAMNGTWLKNYSVEELPGDGSYDCAGLYNGAGVCGQPRPTWRHKLRVNWNTPWQLDLAATWRYFKGTDIETSSDQELLKGSFNPVEAHLPSISYLDLAAVYNVTKKISLTAGINNLLDKDPPLTSKYGTGAGNGNTFPSMYDAMGRKIFLNVTAKF
jgi:outer membrane receptor protein involved in Fe transport